jgi:crotonobetainyl-CoA:carnitine CoA-transferase CaiB-like acyl-CoA transferase
LLDDIFLTRTRDEWAVIFDREGVWWAPVQTTHEFVHDPQAAAAGCFVPVEDADGRRAVATPVDFAQEVRPAGPIPEMGQHTEEVLLELGYEWELISELKELGAIY